MMGEPLALLTAWAAGSPFLLFVGIAALTLLLEDATALAAGVLAAAGAIDPALAVAALLAGTIAGDLGLYALGRFGAGTGPGRRLATGPKVARAAGLIRNRSALAVIAARVTPGLRLPVYLGSGFAALPFARFAAVVAASALVWTPGLFLLGRGAGSAAGELLPALALGALAAILLAILGPRLVGPLTRRLEAA